MSRFSFYAWFILKKLQKAQLLFNPSYTPQQLPIAHFLIGGRL